MKMLSIRSISREHPYNAFPENVVQQQECHPKEYSHATMILLDDLGGSTSSLLNKKYTKTKSNYYMWDISKEVGGFVTSPRPPFNKLFP